VKGIFLWVIQGMGFYVHGVEYREKSCFPGFVNVGVSSLSGDEIWLFNVFDKCSQRNKVGSDHSSC